MRTVHIVPGFLGSELWLPRPVGIQRSEKVWLSPWAIAVGLLSLIRGVNPNTVIPRRPLDAYDTLEAFLATNRRDPIQSVRAWPWDWRRSTAVEGVLLADALEQEAQGEQGSQYLVCHSQGGIVARFAWKELIARGTQGIVRRIVTVGTAHRGTYSVFRVWREEDSDMNMIVALRRGPSNFPHPATLPLSIIIGQDVYGIFNSWQGSFDTLPLPDAEQLNLDPLLLSAYQSTNWESSLGTPVQEEFDRTRLTYWPSLQQDEALPPPSVMRCVGGNSILTPFRLLPKEPFNVRNIPFAGFRGLGLILQLDRRSKMFGLDYSNEGDGIVTLRSALPEGYYQLRVDGQHEFLTSHPILLENIFNLLIDDDPPPPPPNLFNPELVNPRLVETRILGVDGRFHRDC